MSPMRIGVIADSHDRLPALKAALLRLREMKVEAVIHAGDFVAPFAAKLLVDKSIAPDVPLYCVYGNNDGERVGLKKIMPQVVDGPLRISLGGKTIAIHHWIEWFKPEDLRGADIIISGHTHEIVNESRDSVLYLNPGECCGWLTGRCTFAVLDTEAMLAEISEIKTTGG